MTSQFGQALVFVALRRASGQLDRDDARGHRDDAVPHEIMSTDARNCPGTVCGAMSP